METQNTRPPLEIRGQRTGYGQRVFHLGPSAQQYSDEELLKFCGYTPYFGGTVERGVNFVRVLVYTD
jgi:hypothetical protein